MSEAINEAVSGMTREERLAFGEYALAAGVRRWRVGGNAMEVSKRTVHQVHHRVSVLLDDEAAGIPTGRDRLRLRRRRPGRPDSAIGTKPGHEPRQAIFDAGSGLEAAEIAQFADIRRCFGNVAWLQGLEEDLGFPAE